MSVQPTENPAGEWRVGADPAAHDDPLLDCLVLLTRMFHRPWSVSGSPPSCSFGPLRGPVSPRVSCAGPCGKSAT